MAKSCFLIVLLCALLWGCGGGGGGASTTGGPGTAAPTLKIAWANRTRDVNSPSSALSFAAVFHRTDAAGTDLTLQADRDSNLAAHTSSYTASSALPLAGTYNLTITFYAQGGEAGQVVGTAATALTIASNGALLDTQGHPLGTIDFAGTVRSCQVVAGQAFSVGQTGTIAASALDANGQVLVISPGSFTFQQVTGASVLSVKPDGSFTALATGTASLTATVDGIVSPTGTVLVNGPLSAPVLNIAWPARTRDVNSPSSALSFTAVFHRTDASAAT